MDSNTQSTRQGRPVGPPDGRPGGPPDGPPVGPSDGLAALTVVVDVLAGRDLDRLSDTVRAEQVLALRRLVDGLDGQ